MLAVQHRLLGTTCLLVTAVGCLTPSAQAQVKIGGGTAPGQDVPLCRTESGTVDVVDRSGDDCDSQFAQEPAGDFHFGPDDSPTVLAANGDVTLRNDIEIDGSTAFNTRPQFNQGAAFSGDVAFANGLTSTGIADNGGLSVTGNASVSGTLSSGAFTGSSGTFSGSLSSGSLSTGNLQATGVTSTGGGLVQGFFTVNGGSSLNGTTQISNAQVKNLTVLAGATIDMGGNRIQNVGVPTAATDAANKAYVDAVAAGASGKTDNEGQDTASAFGGGASYDPATGHISAPTYKVGTATYNNVGAALNAANTSGLAYFHTNSTKADSSATGADSTAIGPGSTASGAGSFAAGNGATASANGAVAIGQAAAATGTNAIAIGTGASAANGGAAYGDRSIATGVDATAIGPDATATADNAIAVGSGSVAAVADTVSVGTSENQRRITNVAAGTASSDAATVGQLASGSSSVASALGGGSVVSSDGTVSAPSYVLAGRTYTDVGSALGGLSDRVDGVLDFAYDVRKEERRGIVASTAMATAPMPSEPGRTSWAINTSFFHGEVGYGGSLAHRFGTDMPLALTAGFAYARGGNSVSRVGMAGEF